MPRLLTFWLRDPYRWPLGFAALRNMESGLYVRSRVLIIGFGSAGLGSGIHPAHPPTASGVQSDALRLLTASRLINLPFYLIPYR